MKLSVLLPTLGHREVELSRLLDSLVAQDFKNFEVIIVSQDRHQQIKKIIKSYSELDINHISIDEKGLSHARNIGLKRCAGDIVVLSDDDCWYDNNAFSLIANQFLEDPQLDCLLTQIYDMDNGILYKEYKASSKKIRNIFRLMSVSSIEISFRIDSFNCHFDECFGLGSTLYPCGEEIDYLLTNFTGGKKYVYIPVVTVYHPRKDDNDKKRIFAKGALYAKHFNWFVAQIVLLRD